MLKMVAKPRSLAKSLSWFALTLAAGLPVWAVSQPAIAQILTNGSESLEGTGNSDQRPYSFGGDGGFNMFDLMHRAQQGTIRNPYEFWQDQQQIINDEARDFRTRQQEALQQQQPLGTVESVPEPAIVAPEEGQ